MKTYMGVCPPARPTHSFRNSLHPRASWEKIHFDFRFLWLTKEDRGGTVVKVL